MERMQSPIFIGGTGRSGTSIIARILDFHPEIFSTRHEIKLISEPYGLKNLADSLSVNWGPTQAHLAIHQFKFLSEQLSYFGFIHPHLRKLSTLPILNKLNYLKWVKKFPFLRYSAHRIAHRFGLEHYQGCIKELLDELVLDVDKSKPIDTHGVWDPFYITKRFEYDEILNIFRQFLNNLFGEILTLYAKNRWCDDTPLNLLSAEFLLNLYPNMKLIHMLRDPRDVVASYCGRNWASKDVDNNIYIVKNYLEQWQRIRANLPANSYLEVRLEDLAAEPEKILQIVCQFIGVEFSKNLLVLPLDEANTGRYKIDLREDQIKQIETTLGNWMMEKSYH